MFRDCVHEFKQAIVLWQGSYVTPLLLHSVIDVIWIIFTGMVLSEYSKIRILTLWREGNGPTVIVRVLAGENIITTRKTVSLFISRYILLCLNVCM